MRSRAFRAWMSAEQAGRALVSSRARAQRRAACRARLGDVENLQRAEDDCREALEGPFTAWLRQKLDPVAAKLAEKVNLRRREANEKLYEALGCGGLPPGPPAPPASEKSPPA